MRGEGADHPDVLLAGLPGGLAEPGPQGVRHHGVILGVQQQDGAPDCRQPPARGEEETKKEGYKKKSLVRKTGTQDMEFWSCTAGLEGRG